MGIDTAMGVCVGGWRPAGRDDADTCNDADWGDNDWGWDDDDGYREYGSDEFGA